MGDIRRSFIQHTQSLWHQQYTVHILTGKYYRELRLTLAIPIPRYTNQQKKQVICVRLRTGHSLLASSLHARHLHKNGQCMCGKLQDIQHILLDTSCHSFKTQKEAFINKIRALNRTLTVKDILNNHDSLRLAADFIHNTLGHIQS